MWWVYMFQLSWYLHCTYAHLFLDKYKKDFWVMLIHHIVTLGLVEVAYTAGYVCERAASRLTHSPRKLSLLANRRHLQL
jgi:hypothetical protein